MSSAIAVTGKAGPFSGLPLIVSRSLRQHALSTLVTVASVALACGLVMAVFAVRKQANDAFIASSVGYDAVLGARGSQLQLVLNTVFHLETSPGNIPWSLYEAVKKDPRVELAVPYAVGDNYKGFRIVGTTDDIFSKFEYAPGKKFQFAAGNPFNSQRAEAVIGSFVAQRTGLTVGSVFNPYHGINYNESMKHADEYVVTGVLAPSNTPSDRVVWIPIDGIFRMSGHVLRGAGTDFQAAANQEIPDANKEVSSVMLKFKSPQAGMALDQMINKQGKVATLAWPIDRVLLELFDKIGWMDQVLGMVAYLTMAVAAASILASIYNTMNERRREFAILRALGARRGTVFSAIVFEAATIATLGSVGGFVVYAVIVGAAAAVIRAQTGVVLEVLQGHTILVAAPALMIALGALAGVVPALKAYRTDVASNLSPLS
jgi:putative ABC transport system permease protein